MPGGRLERIDTSRDPHDSPAYVFLAAFTGSPAMHLIPGSVADAGLRCLSSASPRPHLFDAGPAIRLTARNMAGWAA